MRVLSSVIDPRMGGPQRRSLAVATELREQGIETVFLIPTGDDAYDDAATERGFETHRIPLPRLRSPPNLRANGRFLITLFRVTRKIATLLQGNSFEVIHANMAVNFQTALAASQTDTPLVWHYNDTLTPTPVRQIAAVAGKRLADELVVASNDVHDFYFDDSVSSQTLYAPVDVDEFDPTRVAVHEAALRDDLGIDADATVVGTVGNLNPIKGHEYLLRAIAPLAEEAKSNLAVPVVGAKLDTHRRYLESLQELRVNLGLESVVTFVGFRSDVRELLTLFDVFVLPSVAEACPIVVLEAMAMECPVVATDVGGVSEEIPNSDHGWVVPPKDGDALAQAIAAVLDNPEERRRRAANARERVESMFSLEACVDRHEDIYRSLAGEN